MLVLHWLAPIARLVPWPWQLAGTPLVVGGLWLAVRAKRLFLEVGTNVPTFNDPTLLVRTGPFARSRNPMYLGFALALLGAATLLGTVTPFAVVVVSVIVTDRWYIRFEERAMRKAFGDAYAEYCRSVRRWG